MEDEEIQNVDADLEPRDEGEVEFVKSGSALKEKKHSTGEDFYEEGEGQLTIDVYQNTDEIIVESPIAGVKPEDLDISITSESVTIKGSREKERRIKDEDYFYQECYWGKFSRSIILPQEVDAEKAEATVKNGVLTIRLPKLNRQRSKKLKVQPS
jgi:HSP20 family protein